MRLRPMHVEGSSHRTSSISVAIVNKCLIMR